MTAKATAIVPRWEWRTFGESFGAADDRLAAMEPGALQESDEVYLLSTGSDASVKVRDGLMDVKHLEDVAEGLEQWKPVLKASFPLSAGEVRDVLGALAVEPPQLARDAYTLDELKVEVIGPSKDLRAVDVHKRRQHYLVGTCMAEVSEVTTAATGERTIAVESEDPELVLRTVRDLGLEGRRNVNLPRGLKAMLGFGAKRYAVIDVGTNSVKFHIGERRADGEWTTVVDRAEVTRLGEGLAETGRLSAQAIERTVDAIAEMAAEAERDDVAEIAAVGTAGLRAAPNRDELIDAVAADSDVHIEVISGDEEARLAYRATTAALNIGTGHVVVFDSGGGSSQFTFGDGERIEEQFSVDVGAVTVTERYGLDHAVSSDEVKAARAGIAGELGKLDGRPPPDAVVGMGGTVTNLAAVKHGLEKYDPEVVQGTVLDTGEIDRQIAMYASRPVEERRLIVGLQPKRAEVILAGACIVRTVLEKLGAAALTVSDRGLRHELIVERFGA
jgi:exopolyphosphatase/guanosine-5'-triphosphate,3'-diphosphate pyrophosphatase